MAIPVTDKQIDRIRSMRGKGKPCEEVAEAVGVSLSTVDRYTTGPARNRKTGRRTNGAVLNAAGNGLPTVPASKPRKPRALVPVAFECPHCGLPVLPQ